ncbi:MAG: ankyrin repeat domain-containing protein [Tannerellaceae bacterium]|nr:ankyrin repeat domain-containing protein [Tannerellaceae bacterium]
MKPSISLKINSSFLLCISFLLLLIIFACRPSGTSPEEVPVVLEPEEVVVENLFGAHQALLSDLARAIVKNDLATFRNLITPGNMNEIIPVGDWPAMTPLTAAIQYGREEMIDRLIEMKADLEYEGEWGLPEKTQPLIVATSKNRLDLVRLFTEKAADAWSGTLFLEPHGEYGSYVTPLAVACRTGNKNIESYLRWLGASEEQQKIPREVPRNPWKRFTESSVSGNGLMTDGLVPEHTIQGLEDPTFTLLLMLAFRDSGQYSTDDLRGLIEKGADINSFLAKQTNSGKKRLLTPLMCAAFRGEYEIVELLIEAGADIHQVNGGFENALFTAVAGGHVSVVQLLLTHGATVPPEAVPFHSSYYQLIRQDDPEILKMLLDQDLSVFSQAEFRESLCLFGRKDIFMHLVEKGITLDSIPDLISPAVMYKHWDLVDWLLTQGVDPNLVKEYPLPVITMAEQGCWSRVKYLLERGADMHAVSADKESLLQMAVNAGRQDVVLLLAGNGVDVQSALSPHSYKSLVSEGAFSDMAVLLKKLCEIHGEPSPPVDSYTALHRATAGYSLASIEEALGESRLVNDTDQDGNTPLHTLMFSSRAEKEYKQIIDLLLKNGARLNARNKEGKTPLYVAVENNRDPSVVSYLIDIGADPELPDHYGHTPLFAAVRKSPKTHLPLLLSRGVNLNARSFYRQITPLHYAAELRKEEAVELLVIHGADLNQTDWCGFTPASLARQRGNYIIEAYLRSQSAS